MTELLKALLDPVQLIGYAGMASAVISFQCKKNKLFFLWQTLCGLFFAAQFACLGGWSGVLCNIFAVFRGIAFAGGKKWHKWYVLAGLEAGFVVSFVLSVTVFAEPWWIALLLLVAQGGGTLAMWTDNGRVIRVFQIAASSPIWLVHNTVYAFSVGGILCESFNILSVLVSFIRFRRSGFEGTDEGET